MVAPQNLWFPYASMSGYRVAQNRNGILYFVCDRRRRPITFRSFGSAQRRASEKNGGPRAD